jgi:hypothetical protein
MPVLGGPLARVLEVADQLDRGDEVLLVEDRQRLRVDPPGVGLGCSLPARC